MGAVGSCLVSPERVKLVEELVLLAFDDFEVDRSCVRLRDALDRRHFVHYLFVLDAVLLEHWCDLVHGHSSSERVKS